MHSSSANCSYLDQSNSSKNSPLRNLLHVDGSHSALSGSVAWALVTYVVPNDDVAQHLQEIQRRLIYFLRINDLIGIVQSYVDWTLDTNYDLYSNNPWKHSHPVDAISEHLDLFRDSFDLEEIILPKSKSNRVVARVKLNAVECKQEINSAELVALVMALQIWQHLQQRQQTKHNPITTICTDSDLVYQYWSKNHVQPKTRKEMSPAKLHFIEECTRLRTLFEANGGTLVKIPGKFNLADPEMHVEKPFKHGKRKML